MSLFLFDTRTPAAATSTAPSFSSDVVRTVSHKHGDLRELVNGEPSGREFVFVELRDGRIFCEFTDNRERRIAARSVTRFYLNDLVQSGMYVETKP